jgi:hypothetical protein
MRRDIGSARRPPAPAALRSGTLLAVLLLHQALMASPLHARMAGTVGDVHAAEISPRGVAARRADPAAADGHCLLEWARSSEGQVRLVALRAPPPGSIAVFPREVAATRPMAPAHGPTSYADVQALVQVFRL